MSFPISPVYRQSLQPYVDPEVLEGVEYLPQKPETARIVPCGATVKHHHYATAFLLVLTGLCLLSTAYNQAATLASRVQTFPVMSHTASE